MGPVCNNEFRGSDNLAFIKLNLWEQSPEKKIIFGNIEIEVTIASSNVSGADYDLAIYRCRYRSAQ